ncbi:hypothetical protein BDW59DRAFT_163457 [Aspergillus cavernicola]|uniref:Tautomerase cis-CaaD-like domain-containing protein n=1 Tax=Aspergillus cavernicola TaxID=176166 RepID=A0ABR4I6B5_9EURO
MSDSTISTNPSPDSNAMGVESESNSEPSELSSSLSAIDINIPPFSILINDLRAGGPVLCSLPARTIIPPTDLRSTFYYSQLRDLCSIVLDDHGLTRYTDIVPCRRQSTRDPETEPIYTVLITMPFDTHTPGAATTFRNAIGNAIGEMISLIYRELDLQFSIEVIDPMIVNAYPEDLNFGPVDILMNDINRMEIDFDNRNSGFHPDLDDIIAQSSNHSPAPMTPEDAWVTWYNGMDAAAWDESGTANQEHS